MRHYLISAWLLIALLPLLAGCSGEEGAITPVSENRTLRLTITPSEHKDDNATANEGIRELTIVVTDDRKVILDTQTADVSGSSDPVLRTEVEMTVSSEARYIYAFANLSSPLLTDETRSAITASLEKGKKIADLPSVNLVEELSVDKTHTIPMSSYGHKIVQNGDEWTVAPYGQEDQLLGHICLYRMIAKVKVTLTNQTATAATVNSMSLGDFQSRAIYFLPYEKLDEVRVGDKSIKPQFPDGRIDATYSLFDVFKGQEVGLNAPLEKTFYIHETDLGEDNKLQIAGSITHGSKTFAFSDMNTDFSFVRRNDYLIIPLYIGDYKLVVKILEERAPIGGYPYTIAKTAQWTQETTHTIAYGGKVTMDLALQANDEQTEPEKNFTITSVEVEDDEEVIEEESIAPDNTNKTLTFYATGKPGAAAITLGLRKGTSDYTYTINIKREDTNLNKE